MYQFIIHPKTGEKLSIYSYRGKQLFKKQFKMSQTNYQKASNSYQKYATVTKTTQQLPKLSKRYQTLLNMLHLWEVLPEALPGSASDASEI